MSPDRRTTCGDTSHIGRLIVDVRAAPAHFHFTRRLLHPAVNGLLDNIVWHTLTGPHARYATGTDVARRYARGFSPIVGFREGERPEFAALAPYCEPGEHFYCDGWTGPAPSGWCIDAESTMFKMVFECTTPPADELPDAVPLRAEHAAAAVELAQLTRPGPFGPRTIELGDYFGCFEGERLVAMAGERMFAGRLREVSGVCTHPEFQGRGLARRLVAKLIARQLARDQIPFLHVMSDNAAAHRLYLGMGFSDYRETVVRVVSRMQDAADDHALHSARDRETTCSS